MMQPTQAKVWYKSRTLWLAVALAVQAALATPELGGWLSGERVPAALAVNAVVLAVLRALTTGPVRL